MKLQAWHRDGFSENLVSWELTAFEGTAIIAASWYDFGSGKRSDRLFEMRFPDSRIQACKAVLAAIQPSYDGHADDTPTYRLTVTDGVEFATTVHAGICWTIDEEAGVNAFLSIWRPLGREVWKLLAIPRRK